MTMFVRFFYVFFSQKIAGNIDVMRTNKKT
jgi:hypothetical protein